MNADKTALPGSAWAYLWPGCRAVALAGLTFRIARQIEIVAWHGEVCHCSPRAVQEHPWDTICLAQNAIRGEISDAARILAIPFRGVQSVRIAAKTIRRVG